MFEGMKFVAIFNINYRKLVHTAWPAARDYAHGVSTMQISCRKTSIWKQARWQVVFRIYFHVRLKKKALAFRNRNEEGSGAESNPSIVRQSAYSQVWLAVVFME